MKSRLRFAMAGIVLTLILVRPGVTQGSLPEAEDATQVVLRQTKE